MKIGLITYSRAKNYGGILQAYALYIYLKDLGMDVEFIDYILPQSNIYNKKEYVNMITKKSRIWGKNTITRWVWEIALFPKIYSDYQVFNRFIEARASFTKKYFSYEELMSDPPKEDLFISGSDQIWNEEFTGTGTPDLCFFLGFTQGKKIAYASSFGKKYISEKSFYLIKPYLEQYCHLAVREESGKRILDQMNLHSEVVLDPTMLCQQEVWLELSKKRLRNKKYILLYQIRYDVRLLQLALAIGRKTNTEVVVVTMNRSDKWKIRGKSIVTPSVEAWLSYIRYADVVVTDSFHATVFSLLFERKFIINTATRKEMATRVSSLLRKLNLEDLEMTDFDLNHAIAILDTEKDWKQVFSILEKERSFSANWLKNAINSLNIGE